ncbi:complement C3-like [Corticium candelabrum]|uniref:complement C3-like n=1 Tax=Corticium candelabrum TaxID=121492 RepID=UPI002E262AD5|nr:complement C3-like [Corticium candelabrum]
MFCYCRYSYEKGVQGTLSVQVGVFDESSDSAVLFYKRNSNLNSEDKGVKKVFFTKERYGAFPVGRRLYIFASICEFTTGDKRNATDISTKFSNTEFEIECDPDNVFYQPHQILQGWVRVKRGGKYPAANVLVEFRTDNEINNAVTDGFGIAKFTLNPPSTGVRVSLSPKSTGFELVLKPVSSNQPIAVTLIVIARGIIQWSTTLSVNTEFTLFQIEIKESWSSKFHLLAYFYESKCDSFVSDAKTMHVEPTFPNNVRLRGDHIVEPCSQLKLTISAKPHSEIALLAVDVGLYMLNNDSRLTTAKVFDELEQYDLTCPITDYSSAGLFEANGIAIISNTRLSNKDQEAGAKCRERSKRFATEDSTLECCKTEGKKLQQKLFTEYNEKSEEVYSLLAEQCNQRQRELLSNTNRLSTEWPCSRERLCLHYFLAFCIPSEMRTKTLFSELETVIAVHEARTYFPHVWLENEDIIYMGSNHEIRKDVTVPDSITGWIISAVALSREGLGVAAPFHFIAYTPIFVRCHAPSHIRKLEQISIFCTAHNYGQKTNGFIRLRKVPESICTKAGVGRDSDKIPLHLEQNGAVTVPITLIPLDVGTFDITVEFIAHPFTADRVFVSLNIEERGMTREDYYSAELDPQGLNVDKGNSCRTSNHTQIISCCYTHVSDDGVCTPSSCNANTTKSECCDLRREQGIAWGMNCQRCLNHQESRPYPNVQQHYFKLTPTDDFIPGTMKAWANVSMNYFQASWSIDKGIIDLLRIAHGCGEQNMIRFGPNVGIMRYLKQEGVLTKREEEHLRQRIDDAYTHQLDYITKDGGFSTHPQDSTATWLTAFVLKSICVATDIVHIEDRIFEGIQESLIYRHQKPNGEYYERGFKRYHLFDSRQANNSESLTSYVLIGILECCNQDDYKKTLSSKVIFSACLAVDYIENQYIKRKLTLEHSKATAFYALTLACVSCGVCNCRPGLLSQLERDLCGTKKKKDENSTYWTDKKSPRQRPDRFTIETTSYMLCSYVVRNELDKARPIAKWLNSVRFRKGLFASTHDTSIGLACLGNFIRAVRTSSHDVMSINVTTIGGDYHKEIIIDSKSKNEKYEIEVPSNETLNVTAVGTGLGMLSIALSYKAPVSKDNMCFFDLNVTVRDSGEATDTIEIQCCTRYLKREGIDTVLLEVEIPTGFEVCYLTNDNSVTNCDGKESPFESSLNVKLQEQSAKSVYFHIEEVRANETQCLTFKALKRFSVTHTAPVNAHIRPYYNADEQCTVSYTPDNTPSQLAVMSCKDPKEKEDPICICGAGRCPRLEKISNRLCNACIHHHYVYKINVKQIVSTDNWLKISCVIEEVIKDGAHNKSINSTVVFWTQKLCLNTAPLQVNVIYHIMGMDGQRFLLDHNSHIEPWSEMSYERCKQVKKERCFQREACKKEKVQRDKSKCKAACKQFAKSRCPTDFNIYLKNMRSNPNICEMKSKICPEQFR